MNAFESPAELRAAFDALFAATRLQLRLYDHDLRLFDMDDPARHAALRAFCVTGGGRSIEFLLDDIGSVTRDHPRLLRLLRDFGHVLAIRQADPGMPRPDQAFVVGDRQAVLLRPDKAAVHGIHHADDPARATALMQDFEGLWQRAPAQVSATTLGL